MEAIILAGGLGTRLRGVIGEQPKCMAPVNGKPFLSYLLQYLIDQGCDSVILSLGYKHEAVLDWLAQNSFDIRIDHVIEHEPLGTGGGISLALEKAAGSDVLVLNGDTMFCIDLRAMHAFHEQTKAATSLALKPMKAFERYGSVVLQGQTITGFEEKRYKDEGLINGGIYLIDRAAFAQHDLPQKYSFEKDYLELNASTHQLSGFLSEAYFIDIGIPEDYERAQDDFKKLWP